MTLLYFCDYCEIYGAFLRDDTASIYLPAVSPAVTRRSPAGRSEKK